jgi:electron transport complex protein RnfC
MLDNTDLVWEGIELLQKYMKAKRVIIGIEENKPQCIEKFSALCSKKAGVEVKKLPSIYPQGGEKVLIYNTIGRIVPEGKLPIDVGAVVINCTTLAAIARYIKTGMPLTEKFVTVDGSAVKDPKNVIAPIGTPISELFDFCGGFKEEPKKVILGGPMMGFSAPNTDIPVMKNTNSILAFNAKDATLPEPTACIRCGRCVNTCPLGLMPTEIELAYDKRDGERLDKLKVNLCMECGCCSFVCPARRPLVQTNKLAKTVLNAYKAQKKAEAEKKEAKEKEAATK